MVCGEDIPIIDFLLTDKLKYSILTPYLKDKNLKSEFRFSLKYTQQNYRDLYKFVNERISATIVSDLDYKIPIPEKTLIPNPINTDKIVFENLDISKRIVIFIGINKSSYIKKNYLF